MEWNFKDGQPIYSQIIDQMSLKIVSGAFNPGDKLPSVRDLAADAGVNPNTMQRALAELERMGLLFTERTSGRFITKEERVLENIQKELGRKYIIELFENLEKLGMTKEEIVQAVTEWAREEK